MYLTNIFSNGFDSVVPKVDKFSGFFCLSIFEKRFETCRLQEYI